MSEKNTGDSADVSTGPGDARSDTLSPPTIDDTSSVGLTITLLSGVLLAFAYYGTRGVSELGFGQAVPPAFYWLALALIFVVELLRRQSFEAREVAATVAITAVYGTLVIFALEGGAYLWENPDAALDEFTGILVLAVAIVVAALAYVAYMTVVDNP